VLYVDRPRQLDLAATVIAVRFKSAPAVDEPPTAAGEKK
jgi:hypothetical protein